MSDVKDMIANMAAFTSDVIVTGTATLAKACAKALGVLPSAITCEESANISMSSMPVPMMMKRQCPEMHDIVADATECRKCKSGKASQNCK